MRNVVLGIFIADMFGVYAMHVQSGETQWDDATTDTGAAVASREDLRGIPVQPPSRSDFVAASRDVAEASSKLRLAKLEPVVFAPLPLAADLESERSAGPVQSSQAQRRSESRPVTISARAEYARSSSRFRKAFVEFKPVAAGLSNAAGYSNDASSRADAPESHYFQFTEALPPVPSSPRAEGEMAATGDVAAELPAVEGVPFDDVAAEAPRPAGDSATAGPGAEAMEAVQSGLDTRS